MNNWTKLDIFCPISLYLREFPNSVTVYRMPIRAWVHLKHFSDVGRCTHTHTEEVQ